MNNKQTPETRKEKIKGWVIGISIGAFPTYVTVSLILEWFF